MSSEPSASLRVPELVCPAGGLPALKAAVDHGADCVYVGFRDETNARNFAGLNFDDAALHRGHRLRARARLQGAARAQHVPADRPARALDARGRPRRRDSASTR